MSEPTIQWVTVGSWQVRKILMFGVRGDDNLKVIRAFWMFAKCWLMREIGNYDVCVRKTLSLDIVTIWRQLGTYGRRLSTGWMLWRLRSESWRFEDNPGLRCRWLECWCSGLQRQVVILWYNRWEFTVEKLAVRGRIEIRSGSSTRCEYAREQISRPSQIDLGSLAARSFGNRCLYLCRWIKTRSG